MEKETRQRLERLTQQARRLLEQEFREQLEGRYDILLDGRIPLAPGGHLSPRERVLWDKLVAAVAHKRSQGITAAAAVAAYLREAAFHTLNRFVALKMLEARKLVQECISRGEDSAGFKEFIALAPGLVALPDKGYRLYVETIFDEIAQEVRALFDRRDAATLLWPRRQALLDLLAALNDPEVTSVWGEDETIGWVYQYFNGEDERRQMRAESQAPRNSRELAVRNQFFTPRYVVQFLTDNSLGRTWCEMRGADTQLAHLDYLVKPEEGFEERAPKDPRDLRVLDPACGSGHFLLYAFDLLAGDPTRSFFGIYQEAWRAEAAPKSEVTGRTLKEDYDSELALRRAVPELILKHNLHGVDIDPRAAQIAGLALWMRAQRAYNDHKVAAQDRPLIGRTNIVTAEPMPGERSMVEEFASTLRPQVLGELFQRMVEEMRLAGELGSLLKIDRALQSAVAKAREQFLREQREPQKFLPGLDRPRNPQLEFDLSGVSDESFFDSAEEHIVKALQQYAAGAPASMTVRRHLFADDAAQGIAFIDLCRKRFDVVLMNPPFGLPTSSTKPALTQAYPDTWKDLYAAFAERGLELLESHGYLGIISPTMWLYSRQLRDFRAALLRSNLPTILVELGGGVMDSAAVESCIWVAKKGTSEAGRFLDLLEVPAELRAPLLSAGASRYRRLETRVFHAIQEWPLCHHVDSSILALWEDHPQRLEPDLAFVAKGNTTFDDFRFVRCWWEVPVHQLGKKWRTYRAGGNYQPFASSSTLVCNWADDGRENRAFGASRHGSDAQVMQSSRYWGRAGLAYPRVGTAGFGVRVASAGEIFSGSSVFIHCNSDDELMTILGILNSPITMRLYEVHGRHRRTETVAVKDLPLSKALVSDLCPSIGPIASRAWSLAVCAETTREQSRLFKGTPLTRGGAAESVHFARCARDKVVELVEQIDGQLRSAFHIARDVVGRNDLENWSWRPNEQELAKTMLSSVVGMALGRFRESELSSPEAWALPEAMAFDPLPPVSPAMSESIVVGEQVLVDDPGHPADIYARVLSCFGTATGAPADEQYLWEALPVPVFGEGLLRTWLVSCYFEEHVRSYSDFRRSAPIYWQLATASGSYSVWLYIHRATGDTLFRVLNDFVGPKLDHEKTKLDRLTQDAGANPSAAQRRELEQQETFVGELQALKTEVARVAPLWKPSLDDGVILNFAPLWRLVPQSRSWQGECKKAWDKLVAGDYDWAHLAMHLWPERVVPMCIDDRSLAIAHGLEDVFWHEDDSGTWRKSRVDDATVQRLIQERTSTTVKAALKDLLSAAAPTASKGRKAKGRSASPRTSAPKPAPAVARATTPDAGLDEATLRAVKAAIASVADGASKADVLAATGLSDGDWNKAIAALLDRGDVTRTGQKRGTRYHSIEGGKS